MNSGMDSADVFSMNTGLITWIRPLYMLRGKRNWHTAWINRIIWMIPLWIWRKWWELPECIKKPLSYWGKSIGKHSLIIFMAIITIYTVLFMDWWVIMPLRKKQRKSIIGWRIYIGILFCKWMLPTLWGTYWWWRISVSYMLNTMKPSVCWWNITTNLLWMTIQKQCLLILSPRVTGWKATSRGKNITWPFRLLPTWNRQ